MSAHRKADELISRRLHEAAGDHTEQHVPVLRSFGYEEGAPENGHRIFQKPGWTHRIALHPAGHYEVLNRTDVAGTGHKSKSLRGDLGFFHPDVLLKQQSDWDERDMGRKLRAGARKGLL